MTRRESGEGASAATALMRVRKDVFEKITRAGTASYAPDEAGDRV